MTKISKLNLSLSPWQTLAVVAGLAGLLALTRPYQPTAAALVLAAGLILIGAHPRNGLFLTIFGAPFFLGEAQDPFIFIIEALAGLTVLSWLVHLALARRWPQLPAQGWLWLLLGLILFNPGVNLKETAASLSFLETSQILFLIAEGRKYHDLFALRSMILHLGGVLFLASCLDLLRPRDLKPLGLGLALIASVLGLVSLGWWLGLWPTSGFYLGLNLTGLTDRHHQLLLATTAFNRQYFNQLLIPALAAAGGLAVWGRGWLRWAALPMALIGLVCLVLTGQRSPFVCLVGMALTGAGLVVSSRGRKGLKTALIMASGVTLGLVLAVVLDWFLGLDLVAGRFLGLTSSEQVTGLGFRPQVWRMAWSMFLTDPISGLGPGTFRLFAKQFAELNGFEYSGPLADVVGTAHNTLLHWLAELGLVTVLVLMGFFLTAVRAGWRAFKSDPHRAEAGVALVALSGFFIFGLFQHILYVSAVALLILVLLAGLINLGPKPKTRRPWPAVRIAAALVLIVLVGGFKATAIVQTPFRPDFRAGFSYGEWPDKNGLETWWTIGRRAVLTYAPNHAYLVFPVRVAHPIVKRRPMRVRVWVDEDHQAETVLKDFKWSQLRLDLRDFRGQRIRIKFETSYSFWPALYGQTGDRRMLGVQVKDPHPEDE
ncbi:MAG: O-antigen ligase family protein [Deltaproteobacteria bacterium]|nr:O-antigen ligase family protein [Deltaproteobacteria bacterium]